MTDEEARQLVERNEAFVAASLELIASTVVDPASPSRVPAIAGLDRIAATVDVVDYVTYANLVNLNAVMRGTLLSLIEVRLMCVGAGPLLDFVDANAFLAELSQALEQVRRKWLH